MEDNIYNIKHISRPILPLIQQGQPAVAFYFIFFKPINLFTLLEKLSPTK